jgi:hypothetical protein
VDAWCIIDERARRIRQPTNVEAELVGSSTGQRRNAVDFAMLTYVSPQGAEAWEAMTEEARAAFIGDHEAWFARNRESITGGHELAWPRRWGRIADNQQLTVHDGPFAETKEALGGVILLRTESLEAALEIARGWPTLAQNNGAVVDVIPLRAESDAR